MPSAFLSLCGDGEKERLIVESSPPELRQPGLRGRLPIVMYESITRAFACIIDWVLCRT